MATLYTYLLLLLCFGSSPDFDRNATASNLLAGGSEPIGYHELMQKSTKPKLFIFYSSEHCAPCLEQLEALLLETDHWSSDHQLVFVDSWTLGAAKKTQNPTEARAFYDEHLQHGDSVFLLDPDDRLLAGFQKRYRSPNALPFFGITDTKGTLIATAEKVENLAL